MITMARVGLKLQRFEVLAAFLIAGFLVVASIVARSILDAIEVPTSCWNLWFGGGLEAGSQCEIVATQFLKVDGDAASRLIAAAALVPLAIGTFLGVPIVAREIEEGTASNTWALARSRSRWLAQRIGPPVVVILIVLGALAIATEFLWAGRQPWAPLPRFDDAGLHGAPVAAKGFAALGLALLAGSVLGRVLPATIVAAALCLALYVGDQAALAVWLDQEAKAHVVAVDSVQQVAFDDLYPGGTHFSSGWTTTNGTFLTNEDVKALAPSGVDAFRWADDHLRTAVDGVPGGAYPRWTEVETSALVLIGLLGMALSFWVVARRRPM
ncbi:MAG TPA: hypothetical protein VFS32_05965 [Candidatus Limnocylindrales bacterium]|nr:hypothetical protein [Candidatus Limnocylindrales bacterium]